MSSKSLSPRIPEPIEKAERERIRRVYEEYDASEYHRRIWSENPVTRSILEHKWRSIDRLLARNGLPLSGLSVLDIGAGEGRDAARFRDLGIDGRRILAFDLRGRALQAARAEQPWMPAIVGDAARLPFRSGSIDIVYQSTMISSILAPAVRREILAEVSRVIAPGGFFLSYDTRYANPANRNTKPLSIAELREAFGGWSIAARSLTAIPQLQRLVGGMALGGCRLLEGIPFLRSHLLALIGKPA